MDEKSVTPAQKEIDEAFQCVSIVQATGDAVDLIASALAHLRKAYELAAENTEPPKEKEKKDG